MKSAWQQIRESSVFHGIRALVHVNVALAICLLLGGAVFLGLWGIVAAAKPDREFLEALPIHYRYRILLNEDSEVEQLPPEEVVRAAESTGLWTSVRIEQKGDESWIIFLSNQWKPGLPRTVAAGGYHVTRFDMGPSLAIEEMTQLSDALLFRTIIVSQILAFLFVGFVLTRRLPSTQRRRRYSTGRAIGFGMGAGLAAFAGAWLVETIQGRIWKPVTEQAIIVEMAADPRGLLVLIPVAVLLAPIGEELFFRGYVFRKLGSHTPRWVAYGYSALLFAGVHFNPSGFVSYTLFGLVAAFALARTGRLRAAMVAHGVSNALTVTLLVFA